MNEGSTHWEGCWREHHECALEYIKQLRIVLERADQRGVEAELKVQQLRAIFEAVLGGSTEKSYMTINEPIRDCESGRGNSKPSGQMGSPYSTTTVGASWADSGKGSVLRCSDKPRLYTPKGAYCGASRSGQRQVIPTGACARVDRDWRKNPTCSRALPFTTRVASYRMTAGKDRHSQTKTPPLRRGLRPSLQVMLDSARRVVVTDAPRDVHILSLLSHSATPTQKPCQSRQGSSLTLPTEAAILVRRFRAAQIQGYVTGGLIVTPKTNLGGVASRRSTPLVVGLNGPEGSTGRRRIGHLRSSGTMSEKRMEQ